MTITINSHINADGFDVQTKNGDRFFFYSDGYNRAKDVNLVDLIKTARRSGEMIEIRPGKNYFADKPIDRELYMRMVSTITTAPGTRLKV